MTVRKLRAVPTALLLGAATLSGAAMILSAPAMAANVRPSVGTPLKEAQSLAAQSLPVEYELLCPVELDPGQFLAQTIREEPGARARAGRRGAAEHGFFDPSPGREDRRFFLPGIGDQIATRRRLAYLGVKLLVEGRFRLRHRQLD